MYMNDSLNINDDCFGSKYVTKINQLTAMFQHGAMANIIPELAIIYQLYYMLGEKCTIDHTINDIYLYCWNVGCRFDGLWGNTQSNVLYMTRALIDAAIVWYEGVPSEQASNQKQWNNLARQTGETIAEIVKEITNFEPQQGF